MNRRAAGILSGIFFGVFTAPVFCVIWFVVPWLRDFPVGEDSPTAIGAPLGFFVGVALGVRLNRRFKWGRIGAWIGAVLLMIAIAASVSAYATMKAAQGWDGLVWLFGLGLCVLATVSAFGLMLAGIFSHLRGHSPVSEGDG